MTTHAPIVKPVIGMTLALKQSTAEPLAGVAAHVIDVWPRLPSGDYLVTLKYACPVQFGTAYTHHLSVFMSELEPPAQSCGCHVDASPRRLAWLHKVLHRMKRAGHSTHSAGQHEESRIAHAAATPVYAGD